MATVNATTTEMSAIQVARFWSRVEISTDFQCWPWRGRKNHRGYGRWIAAGHTIAAHRLAHMLVNGPIGEDKVIRHRCDNPACCNPRHLETGSSQENSNDAVSRSRTARGTANGKTKITTEQADYIRKNPDKLTQSQLAAMFGMANSSISYIRRGRSWKYLAA